MAAARKVSPAASITRCPRCWARLASLAIEVVLPTPLTPTTRVSTGPRPSSRGARRLGRAGRRSRRRGSCAGGWRSSVCSWRAFLRTRSTRSSEVSTPMSAPIRTSSRYSRVRLVEGDLALHRGGDLLDDLGVGHEEPALQLRPEAPSAPLPGEPGLGRELQDVFLGVVFSHGEDMISTCSGNSSCLSCSTASPRLCAGLGHQGGVALDQGQVVAVRQGHDVDVDAALLDVEQPAGRRGRWPSGAARSCRR